MPVAEGSSVASRRRTLIITNVISAPIPAATLWSPPGPDTNWQMSTPPPGAGHGSLHRIDSTAPIIIAGTDRLPKHWRIVNLKAFILSLPVPAGNGS
ncbi:hypothetical protein [Melghirimyces profundicolus]|uniref:hypothetical protein n=1 Tax=Melghirimyces profundicolus TaxID=1242148 RepID=UPI0011B24F84|nr:hypothetical protein [Melghirimyces profundicolus]